MDQRFRYSRSARVPRPLPRRRSRLRPGMGAVAGALVLGAAAGLIIAVLHHHTAANTAGGNPAAAGAKQASAPATPPPKVNHCAVTEGTRVILVSISQRHLWACAAKTEQYDSAVVTGMENLPADLTPTGTYHIYAKQTGLYLNGSDSTGSWHDFVQYWMPFLTNQYGEYGLHDATWRKPGDFGNISPYSSNASHGCVELPLAAAKWLYNWASVGTGVTVES